MQLVIGIDVAKATLEVASWQGGQGESWGRVPNDGAGFAQLAAQCARRWPAVATSEVLVVLEPTGGYELAVAQWAHARGWAVRLPNPRQVRDWARGSGRRAKTDRQDALALARYGAEHPLPLWQPVASEIAELEDLLSRKADREQALQQERNRQQARAQRPHRAGAVTASSERTIAFLEEELRQIAQALRVHQRAHATIQASVRWLRTVPGVGPQTVLPLVALLARWQTLTAGQGSAKGLTAYVGLDPQPHESGTSVRRPATISRQGNRARRGKLYMAALGGVRGNNRLRAFYQGKVRAGKPKKLALVAAAHKLLCWAWAVFLDQAPFRATLSQGA